MLLAYSGEIWYMDIWLDARRLRLDREDGAGAEAARHAVLRRGRSSRPLSNWF
jgi:hypothetical protein